MNVLTVNTVNEFELENNDWIVSFTNIQSTTKTVDLVNTNFEN